MNPVNIRDSAPMNCENCHGQFFTESIMLRKISALLTGTGKAQIIPIPVFSCISCNHVNAEFLPLELKNDLDVQ